MTSELLFNGLLSVLPLGAMSMHIILTLHWHPLRPFHPSRRQHVVGIVPAVHGVLMIYVRRGTLSSDLRPALAPATMNVFTLESDSSPAWVVNVGILNALTTIASDKSFV